MLQLPRPVAGGKCTSEGSEVDEHEVAGEGAKDGVCATRIVYLTKWA